MVEAPQELPKRPSFLSSVVSGIAGMVKGALAGGVIGALGGAVVGAAILGISMLIPGAVIPAGGAAIAWAFGEAALNAGIIGATALGSIGGVAGTMTGVVKSREAGQPSAEDVVNVAKVSFAQGVAVGHNIEHQAQATTKNRDKITTERAAMAMAERQVVN